MATCGLDFGTSNSAVALATGEVLPIDTMADVPELFRSVLFFPEDAATIHAGAEAITAYLDEGAGRFIQSLKSWLPSCTFQATQIRNRTFRLDELAAILLRRIREVAEERTGTKLHHVLLGRPALFSPHPELDTLAETRLRAAAELAGFERVDFLIEPIAAALSYEAKLEEEELVLVGDFGAGTSDFTLMRLGPSRRKQRQRHGDVVASAGVRIGGDDFDAAIMKHKLLPHFGGGAHYRLGDKRLQMPKHVERKLLSWHEMSFIRERSTQELIATMLKTAEAPHVIQALHDLVQYNLGFRLFRAIERAKVALSSNESTVLEFDEERIHLCERIQRSELEAFCAPLLEGLERTVDLVFSRAGAPVEVSAVFLTGGSSYIPAVRDIFVRRFGSERLRTKDAFTSVCEGLGLAAARLS